MAYTVPQMKIFQDFSQIPTSVIQNQNAFVFGLNYSLLRYSEPSEKALIELVQPGDVSTPYLGTGLDFTEWPNQPEDTVVDLAYAKLFADNARLNYTPQPLPAEVLEVDEIKKRIWMANDLVLKTGNGYTLADSLPATGVKVGHYAKLTNGQEVAYRRISGIEAELADAVVGPASTTFTVTCSAITAGGDLGGEGTATLRVTSSSDGSYVETAVSAGSLVIGTLHGIEFSVGAVTLTTAMSATVTVDQNSTVIDSEWVGGVDGNGDEVSTLAGAITASGTYVETWDEGGNTTTVEAKFAVPDGEFTGTRPTTFVFEVLETSTLSSVTHMGNGTYKGSARVRVRSTSDGLSIVGVVTGDVRTLPGTLHGLTFAVASTASLPLTEGESVSIAATPGTRERYDILVFNQELPDSWLNEDSVTVELQAEYSGIEIPRANYFEANNHNWTCSASEISVAAGITLAHPDMVKADKTDIQCKLDTSSSTTGATLYLEYRALRSDTTREISELEGLDVIVAELGAIHPDNPLGYAVYKARLNSGTRSVFYLGVASDTLEGWTAALAKAAVHSNIYAFAPVTTNPEFQQLVVAHVNEMSNEAVKKWRIAFMGMDDQTMIAKYTAGTHPMGDDYLASVTGDLLTFADAGVAATDDLSIGDEVRINYDENYVTGGLTYDVYTITSIESDAKVKLNVSLDEALPIQRVEVYHTQSSAEQQEAVCAKSLSYHSRRVYNCFCGAATSTDNNIVSGEFVAAALAGLCSSVVPQQGLTNIELAGFSHLPAMYQVFTPTQLNSMAGAGTLLVAQDYRGGPIYIRHQLSTAYIDGNLNTSELNLVKNLDSISYFFADRMAGFIGVTNITPDTLARVEVVAKDALDYLMSNTDVGMIGPQLLGVDTKINSVYQDPVLKTTVYMDIDLELPKPFNNLNLTLRAV